ncbi:hypothetical protein E2562_022675 [Oryza meyeriana var. granulata]|uniref:Uncharacterized protein n=1 Tax=Oryza meyeriana var. granulata TaxID=110450 RepID=A0A6G1DYX8_9ORYZ|nr:hypothetical protein E2562_022675 [Oryza meyeriana var. granulata]
MWPEVASVRVILCSPKGRLEVPNSKGYGAKPVDWAHHTAWLGARIVSTVHKGQSGSLSNEQHRPCGSPDLPEEVGTSLHPEEASWLVWKARPRADWPLQYEPSAARRVW